MMRLFRRRTFLLNKKFQFSLLKISLSYCLLLLAVTGISLFLPLMIAMDGYEHTSPEAFQAARQILYLHENFWPAVLLCIFVTAVHSYLTPDRRPSLPVESDIYTHKGRRAAGTPAKPQEG